MVMSDLLNLADISHRPRVIPTTIAVVATLFATAQVIGKETPVRFSRDVLPVLSDKCFHCHGPDASHREAELRLDDRGTATADRGGYAVIVPFHPEKSELVARVTNDDPGLRMPPPESHRKGLTHQEIQTLRQWIAEGAVWGKHWSFEPPQRPELPKVSAASWPRNAIDYFIAVRLEAAKLAPSEEADKRTLIRRVTLDLLGLPPTTNEIDQSLADRSADAYEHLVDRLLASPHYGERMAWPWLDAARYADTGGYQGDPDRTMWPWRDWVIDCAQQQHAI